VPSRALGSFVAVIGVAAAVAVALLWPRAPAIDGVALGARLELRLREQAAALAARVTTLAELPRLTDAVATDEATVRDLTREELALTPRPGETITIAQRFSDGRAVTLLVLPPDATPDPPVRESEVRVRGAGLQLTRTARIAPRARADELTGLLTASWLVDTGDLASEIMQAGAGRLDVAGASLSFGAPSGAPGAVVPVRLPAGEAQLVLFGASGHAPSYPLAIAVAVVSLLAAWWLRRATPAGAPAPEAPLAKVTPLRPLADLGRIGRYAIVRPLGLGGMAEVFLARAEGEAGFGKLVALKVLQPFFARQQPVVDLFLDEARLASGLDHPNIVQIHDLGLASQQYFIAMEYVDGADLAQLITAATACGQRVPVPVALALLRRVCDGLHAAHTAAGPDGRPLVLVHRDVKSANVYVSRNGAVKVGDFGIAKASHAIRASRTEIGQVKGTPGYMAPEHRLGLPVDHRADLYGVGAIAYELLSGQPINLDLAALAERGTDGWPHLPPLRTVREDVSAALDAVIRRALAYERDDRFADCAALESALGQLAAHLGVADDKEIGRWASGLVADRRGSGERLNSIL
jgi:Protein kinase domain